MTILGSTRRKVGGKCNEKNGRFKTQYAVGSANQNGTRKREEDFDLADRNFIVDLHQHAAVIPYGTTRLRTQQHLHAEL